MRQLEIRYTQSLMSSGFYIRFSHNRQIYHLESQQGWGIETCRKY